MQFAISLGSVGLLQVMFSFLAPRVVTHMGERRTILTGLALTVVAGTGMVFLPATETGLFFILAAFGGAGFSLMIGISTGVTLHPFPQNAGLAASIGGFIRMFGGASIAALSGQIERVLMLRI